MILKDISLNDPESNILMDDVLLALAEQGRGQGVLRFWESPTPFVVLGRTSKVQEDVNMEAVLKDRIPVLRRSSGGGTVLQGPGCLNYTLVLSKEQIPVLADLRKSYAYILGKVAQALSACAMDVHFRPISDLVWGTEERKFSGNAQRRGKKFILHHGTFLYRFALEEIEKYLAIPGQAPEYRRGRSHRDFLTNIPVPSGSIKEAMIKIFKIRMDQPALTSLEKDSLDGLLNVKRAIVDVNEAKK